jgi:hypothetical protein
MGIPKQIKQNSFAQGFFMTGLKDLVLQPEYRSDETNIVDSFYIPCLEASIEYSRSVGYFTSGGLALAAKGLAAFVQNEGRMRLVASPYLTDEDVKEIELGYALRSIKITDSLLRTLKEAEALQSSSVEFQRISYLAWLVSEGRLEIKLALRCDATKTFMRGIYHEKVGIFTDSEGNSVAFSGSANETVGGLLSK